MILISTTTQNVRSWALRTCFADDLLMFIRGDLPSIQLLGDEFGMFSKAFGLKANRRVIFTLEVWTGKLEDILQGMGYAPSELPFKYLRVLLSSKRLSVDQCKPLVEKLVAKITC